MACPLCGKNTPNLTAVESGLRLGMQKEGLATIPNEICTDCLKLWRKKVSKGVQISANIEVQKNMKVDLWKNRLRFVRQARNLFTNKVYGEAAISYEKYLKVLEVVYEVGSGGLTPNHFKEHPKEITLICSVYWDLMLIYDADPKLFSKQEATAAKLTEFLKYTPIFSSIIRKADKERRRAKNPKVFKSFLKQNNAKIARCFIATAAFDSYNHPTVLTLSLFRDRHLKQNALGRKFVHFYYTHSPGWAERLDTSPRAQKLCRIVLRPLAFVLKHTFRLQH